MFSTRSTKQKVLKLIRRTFGTLCISFYEYSVLANNGGYENAMFISSYLISLMTVMYFFLNPSLHKINTQLSQYIGISRVHLAWIWCWCYSWLKKLIRSFDYVIFYSRLFLLLRGIVSFLIYFELLLNFSHVFCFWYYFSSNSGIVYCIISFN